MRVIRATPPRKSIQFGALLAHGKGTPARDEFASHLVRRDRGLRECETHETRANAQVETERVDTRHARLRVVEVLIALYASIEAYHAMVDTSDRFQRLLLELGITCSMSRAGDVWDNSAMASFFKSLKTERTDRRVYGSRAEAKVDMFDYLERFYNGQRRHSTLGYLSPAKFEERMQLAKEGIHGTGSSPSDLPLNQTRPSTEFAIVRCHFKHLLLERRPGFLAAVTRLCNSKAVSFLGNSQPLGRYDAAVTIR